MVEKLNVLRKMTRFLKQAGEKWYAGRNVSPILPSRILKSRWATESASLTSENSDRMRKIVSEEHVEKALKQ